VVGDFNIPSTDSPLYAAITAKGLQMPAALLGEHGSNLAKNKRYDQILRLPKYAKSFTNHGGVLDFYAGDHRALYPGQAEMTKTKFTYELSDHLPLWCQLDIDIAEGVVEQDGGQAAE
jgi:endonuclease/exonuclease/phosphatase family metal-dependent hydrolase